MTQRTDRIDQLLREEIGAILARDIQDPRIGFATITQVETAPDLNHARVWVSVIGNRGEREETIRALESSMSYIRRELGPKLHLKRIPMLHVKLDDSIERGSRVLHLIQELEAGRTPDELAEGETLPTPVRRIHQEGDAEEPAEPELSALPPIPAAPQPKGKGRGAYGGGKGGAGRHDGRSTGGGSGRSGGPRGGKGRA
jgi:ribosome-binding factor A